MKFTIIKSCLARFSGIFAVGTPSNIHGTAISYRCAKFSAFLNSVTILTLRDLTMRRLRLCNLNICIEIDAKCWLAEMTLVMTSLPFARVFQCLFTFALVSSSRWLAEIWRLSRRGTPGELALESKFQRRSSKLSSRFNFPPRPQSTPEGLLAG